MPGRLAGLVAVVTGACQGIGRGIADALATEGADVAIIDIAAEASAAEPVAAIRDRGRRCLFVMADVADERQVGAAGRRILEEFGHVDVLVNNASVFSASPVAVMDVAEWDPVVAVNLRGTFLCTRAFLPHMLERGSGRIINVASQLGQIGRAEGAHYSVSKGGVIAFTKALAREVARSGVRVNAVAPGPILTDGLAQVDEAWKAEKLGTLTRDRRRAPSPDTGFRPRS
jgi:3-oxoacyl-[acyl-carrier protein] reductase